jgi:hypothetical protein
MCVTTVFILIVRPVVLFFDWSLGGRTIRDGRTIKDGRSIRINTIYFCLQTLGRRSGTPDGVATDGGKDDARHSVLLDAAGRPTGTLQTAEHASVRSAQQVRPGHRHVRRLHRGIQPSADGHRRSLPHRSRPNDRRRCTGTVQPGYKSHFVYFRAQYYAITQE